MSYSELQYRDAEQPKSPSETPHKPRSGEIEDYLLNDTDYSEWSDQLSYSAQQEQDEFMQQEQENDTRSTD